jgi:hypothetical protein
MPRVPLEQKESFSSFLEEFKQPEDGEDYENLQTYAVSFDSKNIQLIDPHNLEQIIIELNDIPKALFRYRMIADTQTKLVQQLEDEFNRWYAEKWIEIDNEKEPKYDRSGIQIGEVKVIRTEGAKEKIIITRYSDEYSAFQHRLREEIYRLAIIKSAASSIDNYSYKLHAILGYQEMLIQKKVQ